MLRSFCITLVLLSMPLQAEESNNMALVGVSDLQGRVAYQPTIVQQGDRWIAYVGLHKGTELNPLTGKVEGNGTIIVDVTDPRQPRTLAHVPGEYDNPGKESEAQMLRVCNIANGTYMLRDGAIRSRRSRWATTFLQAPG